MKTLFILLLSCASVFGQFNFTDLALTPDGCTTYSIGNVTGMNAYETVDNSNGSYTETGGYYRYVAYAYRTVGGVKIYSAAGFTQSFYDNDNTESFYITLSWSAVANADGYRIQVMDDEGYGVSNGVPLSYFDVEGALSVTIGDFDPLGFVSSPVNSYYSYDTVILTPKTICQ